MLLSGLSDAVRDEDFLQMLQNDIGLFVRRLPAQIRTEAEDAILRAAISDDHPALVQAVGVDLLSRLNGNTT
jgi:hypothetical protein